VSAFFRQRAASAPEHCKKRSKKQELLALFNKASMSLLMVENSL
jgi:hypothetical protein